MMCSATLRGKFQPTRLTLTGQAQSAETLSHANSVHGGGFVLSKPSPNLIHISTNTHYTHIHASASWGPHNR